MYSARRRMSGAGELVNEWNRLVGLMAGRIIEGAVSVCTERCAGVALGAQQDWLWTCFGLASLGLNGLLWLPKLRSRGGIARRRVRLRRRPCGAEARAPWRSTWRHWTQVYPAIVMFIGCGVQMISPRIGWLLLFAKTRVSSGSAA